ncbi:L-arabinose isomerase 2 [Gossypium arboreum]|uniref:L-arabinose isomerase 2 n=1 Tax=Gossypium arboreum TaxID=29729 RepID=A0A0B0N4B1_GOSAR|nr:L-arabinose isomerase 2 [Gossypium arboreum]
MMITCLWMFKCPCMPCCMLLYKCVGICCKGDKMAWKIALHLSTRAHERVPWPCSFILFMTKLAKCLGFRHGFGTRASALYPHGRVEP